MISVKAAHTIFQKEALFDVIAGIYDIGTPLSSKFAVNGLNDTYIAKTERGSFVLRIYKHLWRTEADIRFELELLLQLHEQGVPVSVPIPRRDGGWLTELDAPEGVRYAALFSFAEGTTKVDTETSRTYGRSIAHLHSASDDCIPVHERFKLDADHLLKQPMANIRPFLQHRPDDLRLLEEAAQRLGAKLGEFERTLEWGICHGDLHGWNVFHTADGSLTHFDFDCCGFGWRAYDLAVFWWGQVGSKDKVEQFANDCWDALLEAYLQERPLPEPDLAAIPVFVAVRQIWLIGLHTGGSHIAGSWQDDRYFDRKLKFLHVWMEFHGL